MISQNDCARVALDFEIGLYGKITNWIVCNNKAGNKDVEQLGEQMGLTTLEKVLIEFGIAIPVVVFLVYPHAVTKAEQVAPVCATVIGKEGGRILPGFIVNKMNASGCGHYSYVEDVSRLSNINELMNLIEKYGHLQGLQYGLPEPVGELFEGGSYVESYLMSYIEYQFGKTKEVVIYDSQGARISNAGFNLNDFVKDFRSAFPQSDYYDDMLGRILNQTYNDDDICAVIDAGLDIKKILGKKTDFYLCCGRTAVFEIDRLTHKEKYYLTVRPDSYVIEYKSALIVNGDEYACMNHQQIRKIINSSFQDGQIYKYAILDTTNGDYSDAANNRKIVYPWEIVVILCTDHILQFGVNGERSWEIIQKDRVEFYANFMNLKIRLMGPDDISCSLYYPSESANNNGDPRLPYVYVVRRIGDQCIISSIDKNFSFLDLYIFAVKEIYDVDAVIQEYIKLHSNLPYYEEVQ